MTPTGRLIVAVIALCIGGALVIVGELRPPGVGDSAITAGASTIALVAGYVFGDRNGERRLANALTVLQADQSDPSAPTPPTPPGSTKAA